MFLELALALCILDLSIATKIVISCDRIFPNQMGSYICEKNNITIADNQFESEYILDYLHDKRLSIIDNLIIKITNSTIPKNFSVSKNVTELKIFNSGLKKIHHDDCSKLFLLNTLDFTDNQISEIEANAFSENSLLKQLILKKNRLNSIKNLTSYNQIYHLDVSYNLITAIKENDFHKNFSADYIILSNNKISVIEEKAFLSLTYLNKVDLRYNLLHKLPSDFNSIKIHELYISHNKLEEISCNNIIDHLDVSYNYMRQICNLSSSLISLQYSFNDLLYIPLNCFNESVNLEVLDISNNEIAAIHTQSFRNLKSLTFLNLSYNALEGVDLSGLHFQNTVELRTLDLSHNNINNILYGTFTGIKSLRNFDISYNALTSIDSILTLHDLTYLNIAYNALEKIHPKKIVSHLTKLGLIILNFDEIACEELITHLSVFREHNVVVEVGPAIYNSNIHGHHCNPDKNYYFIDPETQHYTQMVYLSNYVSQFTALVVAIVISLLLLILIKLFDIYKPASENKKPDKIDIESSAKLLSDTEVNNDV